MININEYSQMIQYKIVSKNFSSLGPVVQSIFSLTKSLVEHLLSLALLTKSIAVLFIAEKLWEAFALQKLLTFSALNKMAGFCVQCIWNFFISLTTDVVSFEQLGPVCLYRLVLHCMKFYFLAGKCSLVWTCKRWVYKHHYIYWCNWRFQK